MFSGGTALPTPACAASEPSGRPQGSTARGDQREEKCRGPQNTQGLTRPGSSWASGQGHAGGGGSRSSRVVHAVWVPCGPHGVGRVSCVAGSAMTKDPAWQPGRGGGGALHSLELLLFACSAHAEPQTPPEHLLRELCQVVGRSDTLPPLSWVSLCWAPRGQPRPPPEVRERKWGLGLLLGRKVRDLLATQEPLLLLPHPTPRSPLLSLCSAVHKRVPGAGGIPEVRRQEETRSALCWVATAQMSAVVSATGQRGQAQSCHCAHKS